MLEKLLNASNYSELESIAVELLNRNNYRILQNEMSEKHIALTRREQWPEDVVVRKARNQESVNNTLKEISTEKISKKLLHILQMVSVIAPGVSEDLNKFIDTVIFG